MNETFTRNFLYSSKFSSRKLITELNYVTFV